MPRKSPFKHHRYPRDIILCAVRWYLRYPLSYQDVVDLLAERDIAFDRATVYRWVQKFGPELTKRTEKRLRREIADWHVFSRQITPQSPAGLWKKPMSVSMENDVISGAPPPQLANWSNSG